MRMIHLPLLATALCAAHAFARLPAPSDDAKAKAAVAAAATAWSSKVAAFHLCKAQDKAVAHYHAAMKKAGKTAARPGAVAAPCVDPGVFAASTAPGADASIPARKP
jgi:hypothetical protein